MSEHKHTSNNGLTQKEMLLMGRLPMKGHLKNLELIRYELLGVTLT